jgi:hypothetical protein
MGRAKDNLPTKRTMIKTIVAYTENVKPSQISEEDYRYKVLRQKKKEELVKAYLYSIERMEE